MAHVHVLPDRRDYEIDPDESLLKANLRQGVPHVNACGGIARCSTCRVAIVDGLENCGPRSPAEEKLTTRLFLGPAIRLACQTKILQGAVTVRRLVLDEQDIELTNEEFAGAVPAATGDERRLAVLFTDVRRFTTLSEALPAYDIVHLLNRHFHQMGRIVEQNHGTINTYIGDGFMALFGMKGSPRPVLDAVRSGLGMLAAIPAINAYVANAYQQEFKIGIGVHYGDVVVGNLGSEKTKTFTAIGDAVNFASRIESANKEAGTEFLISEATYAEIADVVVAGRSFMVPVKGKAGEFRLYEVCGLKP